MITPKVFTVSQLNAHIGTMIGTDPELQMMFVEGEISNLRINDHSGHMYFSLKDKKSVVRAVMFAYNVKHLRFRPEEGTKVIMRAQVTVYEPMGQYQLNVEDMQPDGVGVLALRLEQLKKKLEAAGLFDPAHKQPIPEMPNVIGVITSPTGAALKDITDILRRRFPCAQIVLAPVLVQGESAPRQLIEAVNTFSEHKAADVIIIGRGGGSMEDLWAFNDEGLARAIYDCKIPVISAVGHETDVTICDFVSDLRAPTPSAAAELAVPDREELIDTMNTMYEKMFDITKTMIDVQTEDAEKVVKVLKAHAPRPEEAEQYQELFDALSDRFFNAAADQYQLFLTNTMELAAQLDALNPIAILNRGYARVTTADDQNLLSVDNVNIGDPLTILLKDGSISATVTDK